MKSDFSGKSLSQTFIHWLEYIDVFHIHTSSLRFRLYLDCNFCKILWLNLIHFNSLYFWYPIKWSFLTILFIDYFFGYSLCWILTKFDNSFKISHWLEKGFSWVPSDVGKSSQKYPDWENFNESKYPVLISNTISIHIGIFLFSGKFY